MTYLVKINESSLECVTDANESGKHMAAGREVYAAVPLHVLMKLRAALSYVDWCTANRREAIKKGSFQEAYIGLERAARDLEKNC